LKAQAPNSPVTDLAREDEDGLYHSIYDDFYDYTHFQDTDFAYGRLAAQTVGTAVIRFADADVLPFEFTHLADTVMGYVADVQALVRRRQDDVRERVPPAMNFAPLENAATALQAAAGRYKKALSAAEPRLARSAAVVSAVNARPIQSERQLLDPAGLPMREWYRHLLYAPGFYTGYSVKTLPAVREAIEQAMYQDVDAQVARAAKAIAREAALVDAAAADLERLAGGV
jgi:N-acetylated-alpha-linked acidic dipeptidase